MPNSTNNVNVPKIGMNTDVHDFNMEKGQYSFALNASIEDFNGNGMPQIQNDASNVLALKPPTGFLINSRQYVPELRLTLYFLVNPTTGKSEIGYAKDAIYDDTKADYEGQQDCIECKDVIIERLPLEKANQTPYMEYRKLANADCFNLSMDNPVDVEYRLTNTGINIYFVDGKNPLRFMYFDFDADGELIMQDRFKVVLGHDEDNCDLPIYGTAIDCNKIRYNPNFSRPCVEFVDDISGGNLKAGSYQAMVAYADAHGNALTKYFPATGHIPIKTKDITVLTDYETDKALYFKINNLEQSSIYEYYNIVIVETIENFPAFKLVATLPVTQETYIYTGNDENYVKLTANDVFFQRPVYSTASSVTSANDYLFFGRVKEAKKMNLQQVANRIKLYWQTKAIAENKLRDPRHSEKYRGFLRDEVYPMGIVFELVDDNDTVAFHIPGPSKQYFQTTYGLNVNQVVANADVLEDTSCVDMPRNKMWQVYNTGKVIGRPHQFIKDCEDDSHWEFGDFAYWESNRTYPNVPEIWGDLCGQPIRHHKFPDSVVSHIHDSTGIKSYLKDNLVFPMGVKVQHSSVTAALNWAVSQGIITAEEKSRIKGYRIVRGNRAGNQSVLAKGLIYDMNKYNKNSNDYYYPNYPYNDTKPDTFIAPDSNTYKGSNTSKGTSLSFQKTGRYTFHSPNIHFTNPTGGTELKLETEEFGVSEGYFNLCEDQPKYRILSTAARSLSFAVGMAAAFSSITKTCRMIEKKTIKTEIVPIVAGAVTAIGTVPLPFPNPAHEIPVEVVTNRWNTFLAPTATPANKVTQEDCKGTVHHWLSPAHILGQIPESGVVAGIMGVVGGLAGGLSSMIRLFTLAIHEMEIFNKLMESLIPKKNFSIQYNSIGKYNDFKPVLNNGNKVRRLESFTYLGSQVQTVNEDVNNTSNKVRINNWHRETSVYLKTDSSKPLFPNTTVQDNSRFSMDDAGLGYGDLNKRVQRDICSYYASIKDFQPDQYGSIYNVQYLETGACSIPIDKTPKETDTFFGGDTFINRFALKRKHPFFIQTRFNQLDEADVLYSELGNVGFPNYYIDFGENYFAKLGSYDIGAIIRKPGVFFQDLVGTDDTRLDAKRKKFFYQMGYIHLYSFGIPYFLVESDVNVDYRHGTNDKEGDFYPHQANLDWWLQEKNVPFERDNTYFYNKSYSRQNKESVILGMQSQYKFNDEKAVTYNNTLVYSDQSNKLTGGDRWLILRANNFYQTKLSNGPITSVDSIEDDKVLIRSENASQIFGAYDTLKTDAGTIQVDKGGIFANRPKEFAVTELGYMGSQHKDILKTEMGHFWVDAKRGQVFLLAPGGASVDELAKYGMRNWFKQNLPFQIDKDFPALTKEDLDNNFKGIGIALGFDKRYNRFFLTKLDYKVLNKDVKYNPTTKKFTLNGVDVALTDTRYFCNRSFTISFNMMTKGWVSFHSFIPNFYTSQVEYFQTGNASGIWSHNLTNKSYQVYYGKLHPFTIDIMSEPSAVNSYVNSIEFISDTIRYHGEYNWFYNRNITFNKAVVYNERQNSGVLHLIPKDDDDFSKVGVYPRVVNDGTEIEISNSENTWGFNEFHDNVRSQLNNIPVWLSTCNNVDKGLNPKAFNYHKDEFDQARIRGRVCHVRLTNDMHSNYKFIFFLNQFNQNRTFR